MAYPYTTGRTEYGIPVWGLPHVVADQPSIGYLMVANTPYYVMDYDLHGCPTQAAIDRQIASPRPIHYVADPEFAYLQVTTHGMPMHIHRSPLALEFPPIYAISIRDAQGRFWPFFPTGCRTDD
jgi:hypothetical protein